MIDMQRMTRRDEGHIELLGYERRIDAIGDLIEKVCEYEDEAERREQGCEYCTDPRTLLINSSAALYIGEDKELALDYDDGSAYASIEFCPMCGKKLMAE